MARLAPSPFSPLFGTLVLGLAGLVLGGCPLWGDHDDGHHDDGCWGDCCNGECTPLGCDSQNDCNNGEVCGGDNQCHSGTCDTWGCPGNEVCLTDVDGVSECVGPNVGGGGVGGDGAGGSGPDPVYCGNPDDCSLAEHCGPNDTCEPGDCAIEGCIFGFICDMDQPIPTCVAEDPAACAEDFDCIDDGIGYACVSGVCTAPADQCFDQTQCDSGSVCADGKCTPSCADGASCNESFSCTSGVELCTTPVAQCGITDDCGGPSLVCVDGACVPRADDGVCPAGLVWVENGCIPNQSALFVCAADGEQGVCAAGSICLHHSCYISCETPNETACAGLPDFDECKQVTTTSGDHAVCGSAENLGNECDPTAELLCGPGEICVDGYCN
jgi:hypothetical protein